MELKTEADVAEFLKECKVEAINRGSLYATRVTHLPSGIVETCGIYPTKHRDLAFCLGRISARLEMTGK